MNTATLANQIRKALKAQGFERYSAYSGYGFKIETVKNDAHVLTVVNRHFADTNEVAPILAALGFEVSAPNKYATLVYGKVAA